MSIEDGGPSFLAMDTGDSTLRGKLKEHARLIVFTDLDGTLLDHTTYKFDEAQSALRRLSSCDVPLILASSKTAAEISPLQRALETCYPAIVENGAGVVVPDNSIAEFTDLQTSAPSYDRVVLRLQSVMPDLRDCFRGFSQMSATEVAERTGLDLHNAVLAKTRQWSEPGVWSGSDEQFGDWKCEIDAHGLTLTRGGRFSTVSFAAGKEVMMHKIYASYQSAISAESGAAPCLVSMALGDAPNDLEMLRSADIGVVISGTQNALMERAEHGARGEIWRPKKLGPAGWNESVHNAMDLFPAYQKY